MTKTYTRQEVDEILRRALSEKAVEGISHDDLLAAAREVGIPGSAIEAAVAELGESQRVNERVQLIRRRKRAAFLRHLLIFLVVNAGIFFVDQSDGGALWFQYPLIVWGVILA
ncbi:MAG TPA: 2TM domain-containing protein, partial [Polyangiaceae bacterium]|nr:2TM domain-containing protein [Polyangiaceae bacterium]